MNETWKPLRKSQLSGERPQLAFRFVKIGAGSSPRPLDFAKQPLVPSARRLEEEELSGDLCVCVSERASSRACVCVCAGFYSSPAIPAIPRAAEKRDCNSEARSSRGERGAPPAAPTLPGFGGTAPSGEGEHRARPPPRRGDRAAGELGSPHSLPVPPAGRRRSLRGWGGGTARRQSFSRREGREERARPRGAGGEVAPSIRSASWGDPSRVRGAALGGRPGGCCAARRGLRACLCGHLERELWAAATAKK